jgi:hypothetical protein
MHAQKVIALITYLYLDGLLVDDSPQPDYSLYSKGIFKGNPLADMWMARSIYGTGQYKRCRRCNHTRANHARHPRGKVHGTGGGCLHTRPDIYRNLNVGAGTMFCPCSGYLPPLESYA